LKRYGDLWDKIVSYDNLYLAYKKARKNKGWQRQVQEVDADVENKLLAIQEMLIKRTYKVSPYKKRVIFEPKERDIYILPFYPDRIIQHALMNVIAPLWDKMFIDTSYSCREGKGQHKGVKKCAEYVRKYSYCLQGDISKFYPSIVHDILMRIIKRKIKCKGTLWLIEVVVRSFPSRKNVPIGNYTSQWFGNLYMNEVDKLVKQHFHIKGYIRYCDDFLLFGNNKVYLHYVGREIKIFCKCNLELRLSKLRVFPTGKGVDFLGYVNKGKFLLLRKSTKIRFKRRIKGLWYEVKYGLVELDRARSSIDSILGWLSHANTYKLKLALGIYELRGYIMRGLPKNLNTKEDYAYLKDNYDKEYWLPAFQNLLDTRYSWFAIDEKDYVEDDKHKKVHNEQEDKDEYFVYKLNKNAKLYQLGFTVKEVQAICRE